MPKVKGAVRRSQLISTYGVGSVVALEDESFVVRGIDQWGIDNPEFHEPRLQRVLGVAGFARPPASDDGYDVPVTRFPTWYSCPTCRRLAPHNQFTGFQDNTCNDCGTDLVPSRFVIACARGHMADFPYDRWVHDGKKQGQQHDLFLRTAGTSASLKSIVIECSCGASTTMEGAFHRSALEGIAKCFGQRPWLAEGDNACEEKPRTLQRGASNVWFAATRSSLSIPPWSDTVFRTLRGQWRTLQAIPDAALVPTIQAMGLNDESGFSAEQLVAAIRSARGLDGADEPDERSMRREEYDALLNGTAADSSAEFVCRPGELGPIGSRWFDNIMLATRLREVRALEYFTRLNPPSGATSVEHRSPIYFGDAPSWLPAIEVTGEGVFFTLNSERLARWEALELVRERARRVDQHYQAAFRESGQQPDRTITPRLLLTHTLAHVLINQWSLESGYPAASLRERLFVFEDSVGLLIYTATSDSAGSLGGVVGQAAPDRLDSTLAEAASAAEWCSSDPICIESLAAGVDSLNLAACHACLLLPEVSCEERNTLLDRAALVGIPGRPDTGYLTMDV
jgi:hypothetical protein